MFFYGFVDDTGKFALADRSGFTDYLAKKFVGCDIVLTVKKKAKPQGSQSMRYYRGVVVPDIAEACGYSDPDEFQEIHDALAWKFLRLEDSSFGTPRRRSTGKDDMSQSEMTDYIDQCITWAESSIPGCTVRRPDEVDMDSLNDLWRPRGKDAR